MQRLFCGSLLLEEGMAGSQERVQGNKSFLPDSLSSEQSLEREEELEREKGENGFKDCNSFFSAIYEKHFPESLRSTQTSC